MDGSYINAVFNNRRLARQHSGRLVIEEIQTQLHKDKQRSKDKQGSEDKQKSEEIGIEEANETKNKQRDEEIGVEEANETKDEQKG